MCAFLNLCFSLDTEFQFDKLCTNGQRPDWGQMKLTKINYSSLGYNLNYSDLGLRAGDKGRA